MKRRVFGIPISIGNTPDAIETVLSELDALRGRYITFVNVHALMMSRRDKEYHRAQKEAAYAMPDGKPLTWLLRKRGYEEASQIAGPDFMMRMLGSDVPVRHYFYGSTQQTLDRMRNAIETHFPNAEIVGMVSPPFRKLSEEEEEEEIRKMNESGAELIWIGLGAPKQELWMQRMQGKADGVMFGVGAAFDFLAGTSRRAPKWMRRNGLEWLYRLYCDPKRLWKRYLVTNTQFLLTLPGYFTHRKLKRKDRLEDKADRARADACQEKRNGRTGSADRKTE